MVYEPKTEIIWGVFFATTGYPYLWCQGRRYYLHGIAGQWFITTHAWFPNVLQCEYHAETHTHTYFKWWSSLNNKNPIIISNHFISSIYIKRCISHSVNLSVCPLLFEGEKHSLHTEGRTKFLHTWGDKNVW